MERGPFENLEQQLRQMQRQFEELLDMWDGEQLDVPRTGATAREIGVDLADRSDEYVLTADVPGFEADEIDLRFVDDTVHITAEHEETDREEAEDERYLKSERRRQTMQRSIRLPESVDEDAAEATCKNGVLTITVPKTEPTGADEKKIEITERQSS